MPVPNGYTITPQKKQPIGGMAPTPPSGYSLQNQSEETAFAKAVDGTLGQPLSPDIEDRRNPTFGEKVKEAVGYGSMRAGQVWDELKREMHGNNTGVSTEPVNVSGAQK